MTMPWQTETKNKKQTPHNNSQNTTSKIKLSNMLLPINRGYFMCSGMVSKSYSTCGTRHVVHLAKNVSFVLMVMGKKRLAGTKICCYMKRTCCKVKYDQNISTSHSVLYEKGSNKTFFEFDICMKSTQHFFAEKMWGS